MSKSTNSRLHLPSFTILLAMVSNTGEYWLIFTGPTKDKYRTIWAGTSQYYFFIAISDRYQPARQQAVQVGIPLGTRFGN